MKSCFLSILFCLCLLQTLPAQDLYVRTFGHPADPAIVFLHGGPGYHAVLFEVASAQALADAGFYVMVYDRRGEGRSEDPNAVFTFEESVTDLTLILDSLSIEKTALIGHSFGGIVGIKFAEQFPDRVNALVLMGAPVSLQQSFQTIIRESRKVYEEKGENNQLQALDRLSQLDSSSLMYSSLCFQHAMANGFYSPDSLLPEAQALYRTLANDSIFQAFGSQMTMPPTYGFWKNEQYTTIDLTSNILALAEELPVYGIYGREDGLYSADQIHELAAIIGEDHLILLDHCSHNVFMDRRATFIRQLAAWL